MTPGEVLKMFIHLSLFKVVNTLTYSSTYLQDSESRKCYSPSHTQSCAFVVDSRGCFSRANPRLVPTSPATCNRPPSATAGRRQPGAGGLRRPGTGFNRDAYTTHDTTKIWKQTFNDIMKVTESILYLHYNVKYSGSNYVYVPN